MKKLILILLLTQFSFGQSSTMLLLFDGGFTPKNAEISVYLASLTTPISKTYAATLDSFITKVKDSLGIANLSDKFDVMYDLGGETSEQSLKNLVKRSHDATAVNSPTWTQWQGFTGANTKYLNTNFNDSTQGISYTLNSASMGIYSRTNASASIQCDMGAEAGATYSLIQIRFTGDKNYSEISSGLLYSSNNSTLGMFVVSRTNATTVTHYRNGSTLGAITGTKNVVKRINQNFYIFIQNDDGTPSSVYSTKQFSFAFIGAGLTPTEVSKFTNCVEWLMDRKGTGVIP